jgi:hypothetical protein
VWQTARRTVLAAVLLAFCPAGASGEAPVWHAMTLDFAGPAADEAGEAPNPFLDFRLQVTFTGPSGRAYNVPGFFDGDGKGGGAGRVWRARFTPDEPGRWTYRASFRRGPGVAVDLDAAAGEATGFDGQAGAFTVAERDPSAAGFLKWGRLEYAGTYYLKFRDGPYWIKGGTDSPENFLAYAGFDGTPNAAHRYGGHARDWKPGDPDWGGGKGRGIIGALNYLAAEHVNSIYFLPMNVGGDGKDVWPFAGRIDPAGSPSNDNTHYDISKLSQWEIVFAHAQRRGIFLHVVFNEAEGPNKKELDGAALGPERKLFYREMVARFGHHVALQWNLSEEYDHQFKLAPDTIKAYAGYLRQVDPYGHPITVHNCNRNLEQSWGPFLGDDRFSITSLQHADVRWVEKMRALSAGRGRPLPVGMDEFPEADSGDFDALRRTHIWPIYLSGGQMEFILPTRLKTDDFREYEAIWRYTWHARKFMEEHLPFHEMEPADGLLAGKGEVFAKPGVVYAVYLPDGGEHALNLKDAAGTYRVRWYDPRTGEFVGSAATVTGGGRVRLGPPPRDPSQDWAVLLPKTGER